MKQLITIEVDDFCILPNGDVKIQLPPHQVTVSGNIVLKAENVIVLSETQKEFDENGKQIN